MQRFLVLIFTIAALVSACSAQVSEDEIATIVAQTLEAQSALLPTQAELSAGEAATGSIAGTLIYPSEFIPAMWVVAFNTADVNQFAYTTTSENDNTYQIDGLQPGSYYVVSYPQLEGIEASGGYTPAVACGLRVECTDHGLIAVPVTAGQVTQNINPHDWYAPEGAFPDNPNQ